jgi:hypothetical protein
MFITYLLKVSLLLAILTLGYRWLIQFETFSKINRALLWLNVVAAWSLPFIPLPNWGPVTVQQEFHHRISEIVKAPPVTQEKMAQTGIAVSEVVNLQSPNWNWMDWIMAIYFSGVIVLTARFIFQVGKLLFALWKLPTERLENGIVLIRNNNTAAPYSFFRWIICNPEKHAPDEIDQILAHETEHVHQWHSLDLLLAETQRILLWFNPVSWFHQQLVQENLEYLADRAVLENGFHKKQYQFSLLKAVMQHPELPLTNSFAQSLLKKRIKMMNRKPSDYWVTGKYAFLIIVLYLSSAFVAPYKNKLIDVLPTSVKPAIRSLGLESHSPHSSSVQTEPTVNSQQKTVFSTKADNNSNYFPDSSNTITSKNKWVVKTDKSLYWAISPLATITDIAAVKSEIEDFGGSFSVYTLQYDAEQSFITNLVVAVTYQRGMGVTDVLKEPVLNEPMKGIAGVFYKDSGLSVGYNSVNSKESLSDMMKDDYKKALNRKKLNQATYTRNIVVQKFDKENLGIDREVSIEFPQSSFGYDSSRQPLEELGIYKTKENFLLIKKENWNTHYYQNEQASSTEKLNSVSIDDIHEVLYIKYKNGKEYYLVITKQ